MSIQNIKNKVLEQVEKAVKKSFGQKPKDLRLDYPPEVKLGDFTIECFLLAEQFHQNPAQIAKTLADHIACGDIIKEVKAVGAYLNFKISNQALFSEACAQIISQDQIFGSSSIGQNQRVMIEYLSPNTNKPLHLGHLRNGALGMALANLYQTAGYTVIKANLVNDRGVHICKSMLAWQKWAQGATPESTQTKGDHFVGRWYVRYSKEAETNPELENDVQKMLKKWETGDKEIIKLWKMMNNWVYPGFTQTYKAFGLEFDVFYYESDTYKLGKAIVAQGIKKKIFYKDDKGAAVFDLPEEEFGRDKDGNIKKALILRADGTSVYMTQDIGTALLKTEEHQLDRSIYVVGCEQEHHFKCLFKILQALGYSWAGGLHHLSYGMVYLPEGKMKSREGKVVDADDLIDEMTKLAAEEIRKRDPENKLSGDQIQKRAAKIGVGAIKFYLLRVGPHQDIHFDPKASVSFDGVTGPYCQYAYARTAGILRNAHEAGIDADGVDFGLLGNNEELALIQKLMQFPDKALAAAEQFNPSQAAGHIYETAQAFNQFYHQHSVLAAESKELIKARLALVKSAAIVLKKGLNLLGIEALEEM